MPEKEKSATNNNQTLENKSDDGSILKFFGGMLIGVVASIIYTRMGWSKPAVLEVPEKLKGNVISTAAEYDLYDLDQPLKVRQRALEVFMSNRAAFAVKVDEEFGHPFLEALYRKRVIREASEVRMQWTGFEMGLEKAALRKVFEKKYRTSDPLELKQAMLMEAFLDQEFLVKWVDQNHGSISKENLYDLLTELGKLE